MQDTETQPRHSALNPHLMQNRLKKKNGQLQLQFDLDGHSGQQNGSHMDGTRHHIARIANTLQCTASTLSNFHQQHSPDAEQVVKERSGQVAAASGAGWALRLAINLTHRLMHST
jgi:hypothetical protein